MPKKSDKTFTVGFTATVEVDSFNRDRKGLPKFRNAKVKNLNLNVRPNDRGRQFIKFTPKKCGRGR